MLAWSRDQSRKPTNLAPSNAGLAELPTSTPTVAAGTNEIAPPTESLQLAIMARLYLSVGDIVSQEEKNSPALSLLIGEW